MVAARLQLVFVVPSSVQLLFAVKAMNYVRARHTAWNSGYSIRFFIRTVFVQYLDIIRSENCSKCFTCNNTCPGELFSFVCLNDKL